MTKSLAGLLIGVVLIVISGIALQQTGVGIFIAAIGGIYTGRWIERNPNLK